MINSNRFLIGIAVLGLCFSIAIPAWAIPSPEPMSGGRFFRAKGTKSGHDYLDYGRIGQTDAYARTEDYYHRNGLQAGPVNIKPSGSYAREYDTNVFLTENGQKRDWIDRFKWGVDGILPINEGQHSLYAGVQSLSEVFERYDQENHTDWDFNGGGEMNFNSFSLDVFEQFRNTSDRSDNELTQRVERDENYLVGLLTVPLNEFFIETEVSDWNLDFQDKAFKGSDRNEFRVFPRLGVNVGANTQALVEYGFTNLNYEVEDRSGTSNELSVGVRGLLGEYLSYQAWGGFEVRTYDQDSRNRYAGFIGRGELVYQPSDFTRIALEAHRRVVESVSQSQSYYVNNEVSLKLRRQLMEKLYANARGTMRLNNYDTERDDFYIEPAVGLEYILPYTDNIASIFGEYRWRVRESDTSNNDYHGQLIDMGVKAEF